VGDEAVAEQEVLIGYDDDLAQASTRLTNRIRGRLTHTTRRWSGRSGRSSIRGERHAPAGNQLLKRAFFPSPFAALKDPASRQCDNRKRAEGTKHNAALICLPRRRCDANVAMLRDRKPYRTRPTAA
jgi:hypothetical protein